MASNKSSKSSQAQQSGGTASSQQSAPSNPTSNLSPTNPMLNPYGVQLFPVKSPAGSDIYLQTQEESDWYVNRRDRYLVDNTFANVSDLQDLDRVLILELLVYRWSLWMSQGFDYLFSRVDESQLKSNVKEYSVELRLLKQSLGIDKATRDRSKSESLSDYVENLLVRAKEFGYHRNAQYQIAVTKIYELRSMIGTFDRCDEEERSYLDLSPESILEWIRTNLIANWDELSESYRKQQAIWVRDM